MRLSIFLVFFVVFSMNNSLAQQALRKLHYNINQPSMNVSHPFISGDGNTMLYLTDYTDNGGLTMFWTQKSGTQWMDGREVNRLVNRPDMTLEGAFSLNYDGTQIIVTSRKSGLGGFDLWYSDLQNGDWQPIKNFGAPINSRENEGAAVLTTDGKGMYYMRCSSMTEQEAEGCKLYFSEKKYGIWQTPEPLPENINNYNPQFPRILADGETLLFSSKSAGGKGGFDVYKSQKVDGKWQDPVNLEFANTSGNDQYISVPAKGRYLYKGQRGERDKMQIVMVLFPEEYKPREVYRVSGTVKDNTGIPLTADVRVFDIKSRKRLINAKTESDGSFSFVLVEGADYDMSIEADGQLQYFSKIYELDEIPVRDREALDITLEPVRLNEPIINDKIIFDPDEPVVSEISLFEVRRIASVLRANPNWKIRIHNYLYNYIEDTLPREGLTEIKRDTSWVEIENFIPADHISTTVQDTVSLDSLRTNGMVLSNESDTLYVMVEQDSIHLQNAGQQVVLPAKKAIITTLYHNNRTLKEANALRNMFIEYGVEAERIITEGQVDQKLLEKGEPAKLIEITFLPVY